MSKQSNLRVFIDNNPPVHYLVVRLLRLLGRISPCVFCQIVQGKKHGRMLFQDGQVTAFRDAHPAASTHILIVPNRHIPSINDLLPADEPLIGHMLAVAGRLARQENLLESGYSLTVNTGLDAGQTVFHLHMHLKAYAQLDPSGNGIDYDP